MKKYKHVFFDLDHTLWDFDRNTSESVEEMYTFFNLSKWPNVTLPGFMEAFHEVNNYLWDKFNHGHIGRSELRNERFKLVLQKFGVDPQEIPKGMGQKYLEIAPVKSSVIPDAVEVLEYLSPNYRLHIISNGFDDVQHTKLSAAKIRHYFDKIITSDSSKFRKPQKEIFEFAVKEAGAALENSIMIGDNIDTDIIGAQNAAMDHVFFNPNNIKHSFRVNFEIDKLRQLMNIL